ncbi:MAG TPA: IPT/TIG domain-containing protein [Gemmataceae bacterium]|nr:IPT/TIG domain-containing protein [Gemmataceae bacterium]
MERPRRIRRSALQVEQLEDRVTPTLLGQQLFPVDYPWNQNISNAPVAANSAAVIAHIGASVRLHPDWGADSPANGASPLYGIPVNIVHGDSTATVNVAIDNYPDESDIVPVPIPANAVLEGDYQNGPNPNGGGYNAGQRGDSHLIVWDEDNNIAYELYGVTRPSDPTLFPNNNNVELPHTDGLWHAAQETVWNMNTDMFRTLGATSADAAGLSILAGLARPDEGLPVSQGGQGAIDHALRVTLPAGDVNPQYIYPASHMVSTSQGANNLPLGSRLRLANTPAVNALIANMPPESQIVARAMQQYGLVVADIGSAMYVTGASASVDASNNINLTWNLNDIFASNGLEVLNAGDFQVVNLTPVVTGLSASNGVAGATLIVAGQNFSGAAGRLSVFFGGVAANSVTVLSDTQLSVVVPNGAGTVDVTVQSGVGEADNISSNPNANVNAPIFGYGTSAKSAADHFTYAASPPAAAEFPGLGVWRYESASGWRQLTSINAAQVGVDSLGDVAAEFPGLGVWRFEDATGWKQLAAADASQISIAGAGVVATAFPGFGVWRFEDATGWKQLTAANPRQLALDANGDVAVEIPAAGVWRFEDPTGWKQLTTADASQVSIAGAGDVAVAIPGAGVWRFEDASGWKQLSPASATLVNVDANGDAATAIPGAGVWSYEDATGWVQLSPADVSLLALDAAGDAAVEMPGAGVWLYQNGFGWVRLTVANALSLSVGA